MEISLVSMLTYKMEDAKIGINKNRTKSIGIVCDNLKQLNHH